MVMAVHGFALFRGQGRPRVESAGAPALTSTSHPDLSRHSQRVLPQTNAFHRSA